MAFIASDNFLTAESEEQQEYFKPINKVKDGPAGSSAKIGEGVLGSASLGSGLRWAR